MNVIHTDGKMEERNDGFYEISNHYSRLTMCNSHDSRCEMKRFWLSWYKRGAFQYYGPWWVSGYTTDADGNEVDVVCAAVEAVSEDAAKRAMETASNGGLIEWRFCTEKPEDWEPFCDRFPRADWMVWSQIRGEK